MLYRKRRVKTTKREQKFKRKVTAIAKKAVFKVAEKKQWADNGPYSFTTAFVYATTPISSTVGTRWLFNMNTGPRSVTGGIVDSNPGRQGAGGFQRIGNSIMVHEVSWSGTLRMINNGSQDVRMILMVESNPEGVSFASNELLYDFGSGQGAYSPYSYSESHKRFKILYDKTHSIATGPGNAGVVQNYKNVKIHHKFKKPLEVTYYDDTTSTGSASIEHNAIYLVLFAGGTNATLAAAYGNILYSDV